MKYSFILILFILIQPSWANYKPLEQFDKVFYYPQDHGLEDLYFEVHHNRLLDNFKKNFNIGELKELYYKVYWMKGNKADIEVVGLPEGFKELKDQLKMLIIERLDFVLPVKFNERYANMKFIEKEVKGKKTLEVNPDGVTAEYSNLVLEFSDQGLLSKVVTKDATVRSESVLSYKNLDGSSKTSVVEQVVTDKVQGIYLTKLTLKLKYDKINSFTLPTTLEGEGVQSLNKSLQAKEKIDPVKENWAIAFKNYKTNSGEASRHFAKKKTK